MNSSDYFAYKRNKIQAQAKTQKKSFSKISFAFQLFFTTFTVIFIIIVIAIMKFSSKVDIEYQKGDLSIHNSESSDMIASGRSGIVEDEQRKIDKRLRLIQQEENAPSEARIIKKEKDKNEEVIHQSHIENHKKIEKLEKQKEKKEKTQKEPQTKEIKLKEAINTKSESEEKNVTIMSKVLIGRFGTFEDAQKMQTEIKTNDPNLSPFVKKVGEVFSVQMGSYQDFAVAKGKAQILKAKGYDVWIYQQ